MFPIFAIFLRHPFAFFQTLFCFVCFGCCTIWQDFSCFKEQFSQFFLSSSPCRYSLTGTRSLTFRTIPSVYSFVYHYSFAISNFFFVLSSSLSLPPSSFLPLYMSLSLCFQSCSHGTRFVCENAENFVLSCRSQFISSKARERKLAHQRVFSFLRSFRLFFSFVRLQICVAITNFANSFNLLPTANYKITCTIIFKLDFLTFLTHRLFLTLLIIDIT